MKKDNFKLKINQALQQMTGFKLGKWGADPTELVSSMGLKKEEWDYIKDKEESGYLDNNDIKEINEYFEVEK
jgi:CTP:phosphocholine cytidylyltransferase-like protein